MKQSVRKLKKKKRRSHYHYLLFKILSSRRIWLRTTVSYRINMKNIIKKLRETSFITIIK